VTPADGSTAPVETALLLTVPAADPVVGPHRSRLDRAARVGVPAHVTIVHPFAPLPTLGADELAALEAAARSVPAFTLRFARTAWFDDTVVYLEPEPVEPVLSLIAAVVVEFPDFPPYGGAYAEPVPHLTLGHEQPLELLRVAELATRGRLPLEQEVTELALWAGPPLLSEEPGWRQVAAFPLG
jgi:hypothetical protein